jgi:hypothetical protein
MDHKPVTEAESLDGLECYYGIVLSVDSPRHIACRRTSLKLVDTISKDSDKLNLDESEINAWYMILGERRKSVPPGIRLQHWRLRLFRAR